MFEPRVVNLNDLVLRMDGMLRHLVREDIELVTLAATCLGNVKVDPSQLERVLLNLVVNAQDAMPDGGKIVIETANATVEDEVGAHPASASGEQVVLSVKDTGGGMPEEVRARVFEPFFTTKEAGKGTGLGLSSSHGIVARSGGQIAIDSEPDRGTTVRIYLPVSRDGVATASPPEREVDRLLHGSGTVLLVEDEPAVRGIVARVLRDAGYKVLEAADGNEALALLRAGGDREIDLLLTDVVMPRMGGRQLAGHMRQEFRHTKVLFMSGYSDDGSARDPRRDVDADFLPKPFSPMILHARSGRYSRRRNATSQLRSAGWNERLGDTRHRPLTALA